MKDACSCHLFLYGDDSALLLSHKNQTTLESIMSAELTNINAWLIDNKLSLHLRKTEAIMLQNESKSKSVQLPREVLTAPKQQLLTWNVH